MKRLFFLLILLTFVQFNFSNCKHKMETKVEDKPATQERAVIRKVDTSNMEYSSMYVCPMHCKGSGSDKPGVCPVCGMDYELNDTYQKTKQDSLSK